MKEKLLRAQAWKYFIPVFCIPQVASHFLINNYVQTVAEVGDFNVDTFTIRLAVFLIISMLCTIPFYLWMWAVGNELPRYIPEDQRTHPGFFNVALVSSFLLSGLSSLGIVVGIRNIVNKVTEAIGPGFNLEDFDPTEFDPGELLSLFSELYIPLILILIAFVLALYTYYFSAKTISKARAQDKPKFSDNFVNFILHFVFFGSIWYFQPEIKKVMDNNGNQNEFDNDITNIDDLI